MSQAYQSYNRFLVIMISHEETTPRKFKNVWGYIKTHERKIKPYILNVDKYEKKTNVSTLISNNTRNKKKGKSINKMQKIWFAG